MGSNRAGDRVGIGDSRWLCQTGSNATPPLGIEALSALRTQRANAVVATEVSKEEKLKFQFVQTRQQGYDEICNAELTIKYLPLAL